MLIDTRPTRPARLYSRSTASRWHARWVEVDARVEVWRADKDGAGDGDGGGGEGGRKCCHERGTKVCALLCALFPRPLPAIFALHIATHVLSERTGKPLANQLASQNRRQLYERMLRDLQTGEAERAGTLVGRPLDEDDVALLFEDVHRGRSVVPPHAVPVEPSVVRWDPARARWGWRMSW
ncbi:hypothetical protein B0H14DRAFT_3615853 [Mycena olivaceomarginata]|nr:hypothetical protein B0H14DRAFT_3615853 [Mycena olivaceomarginata]